jgi:hypothetical protein
MHAEMHASGVNVEEQRDIGNAHVLDVDRAAALRLVNVKEQICAGNSAIKG